MRPFLPAYSQEALDTLMSASRSDRRQALALIARLGRFPDRSGDAPLPQADDRDLRIRSEDNLVVSYYVSGRCRARSADRDH